MATREEVAKLVDASLIFIFIYVWGTLFPVEHGGMATQQAILPPGASPALSGAELDATMFVRLQL